MVRVGTLREGRRLESMSAKLVIYDGDPQSRVVIVCSQVSKLVLLVPRMVLLCFTTILDFLDGFRYPSSYYYYYYYCPGDSVWRNSDFKRWRTLRPL